MAGGPPVACGNCGTAVEQDYCPACGQSRREDRKGFGALLREFTDAYLSFDSKIARTLATLFFRPGRITRDFLDGTRRRYITPLRLYIFSTILLFLLFRIPLTDAAIEVAEAQRGQPEAAAATEGDVTAGIDAEDVDAQVTVDDEAPRWLRELADRQHERFEKLSPDAQLLAVAGQAVAALPKALFLILPLIALYLKVLLLGTRSLYYDHFIFALHQQSFALILTALLTRMMPTGWAALVLLTAFALHWTLALRRVYRIGWPRTLLTLLAMMALAPATAVAVTGAIVVYAALSF